MLWPLLGTLVCVAFAVALARQYLQRRRPYLLLWAIALVLYAVASFSLLLGALDGWTDAEYRAFWLFGAALTVPYLAAGEVFLLARRGWLTTLVLLVLAFATAFAFNRIRTAMIDEEALVADLPRGSEVFAADPFVLTLARVMSTVAYVALIVGTLWSAWRMRGAPELRSRLVGTALIALGATVVAAGSVFAATGNLVGFSLLNTVGVCAMFWGFLRASTPVASHS